MSLLSIRARLTREFDGRTLYDRFELIVSSIVVVLISSVVVYTTIMAAITLFEDFSSSFVSSETTLFKDTFGIILTILILLEFNHSIISALRRRTGAMQVSMIVLITITVIARKLILLDYASTSLETLLGFGGLALALGVVYWLLAAVEQRSQSLAAKDRVPSSLR